MEEEILVVTESFPPVYGGADIAAYRYFSFLNEQGQRAWLAANYNTNLRKEQRWLVLRTLKFSNRLNQFGFVYVNFIMLFLQFFFFLVFHPRIKIIHAFNSALPNVQAAVLAGKVLNRKVLLELSLRGADDPQRLLDQSGSALRNLLKGKTLKRWAYLKADGYIAKSSYLTGLFKEANIKKPVFEIPYFVDTNKYFKPDAETKSQLRQQLHLPENKIIISFLGGISERKGVNILTDAFKELTKRHSNLFLLLLGPTGKYDLQFVSKIKMVVDELGSNTAHMAGYVSHPQEWLMASDIYVLPSWREGFPISILESLCCGLHVVASDIPEINHVQIEHGVNGRLFTTGSSVSLLQELEATITHSLPGLLDEWQRAREKYDVRKVAARYESAYSQVLN